MTSSSARASRERASRRTTEPEGIGRQDEIERLARSRFGITYLYPIQRFVVSNVLEGNPQIVVLPTGAGKSLCFQLPSLMLPGPTLVLMPLLSLLSDQERKLRALGVPVGLLKGGLSERRSHDCGRGSAMAASGCSWPHPNPVLQRRTSPPWSIAISVTSSWTRHTAYRSGEIPSVPPTSRSVRSFAGSVCGWSALSPRPLRPR